MFPKSIRIIAIVLFFAVPAEVSFAELNEEECFGIRFVEKCMDGNFNKQTGCIDAFRTAYPSLKSSHLRIETCSAKKRRVEITPAIEIVLASFPGSGVDFSPEVNQGDKTQRGFKNGAL